MRLFTKTDAHCPDALRLEALGLQWLAEAMPYGGVPVVPVIEQREGEMDLPYIPHGRPTRKAAYEFGKMLAVTHAAGASHWGCPPKGWKGNGVMGRISLPLVTSSEQTATTWGEFFADQRIGPCLTAAHKNGSMSYDDIRVVEMVMEELRLGRWDAPQPSLVQSEVARIHGDLWCGNVLWTSRSELTWADPLPECCTDNTVAVLIDPAAQGGHAETDLAFLEVFGQTYLNDIYEGYRSVSELAPGWEHRRRVHQLYLLAVHAAIFGGAYGAETTAQARQCLQP